MAQDSRPARRASSSSPAGSSLRSARGSRRRRSGGCWSPAGSSVQLQKFDPYINVDPGHDVALPARRGVRHRGRRRDRSRPRPLRALHRREHEPRLERHRRRDLQHGDPPRAARGLSRRDGPGRPAHHRRDQAADPADGRVERRRLRDHRDRRDRRRHRVAAVPRGDPPVPGRRRPPAVHVHPPDAGALHRPRRRAEDEADAALGQRAAADRDRARHGRLPVGVGAVSRHPPQDRAVREPPGRGGRLRARRARHLPGAARVPRRGGRRLHPRASTSGSRRRTPDLDRLGGDHARAPRG